MTREKAKAGDGHVENHTLIDSSGDIDAQATIYADGRIEVSWNKDRIDALLKR